MARTLVVAGVASGVGKTTVTLGLLAALRRRGLRVQAFKVGPDFIDPGLHALATGRPSYALDGWMCGRAHVLECVAEHAANADVALVEGVMGCFDGAAPASDAGSTAEVAKWLGAPVVLVLDASAQARSAAAVVQGFERFDPALDVAGVVANRVGSAAHGRLVLDALAAACRAAPLGALVRDEALAMPERHLGLVTAAEGLLDAAKLARLADAVESSLDLDRLLSLARETTRPDGAGGPGDSASRGTPHRAGVASRVTQSPRQVRIGVARDAAFQFYYAENLDRLRAAGAELLFWSPLADAEPPDADGLYLGGGYPELHAARLAENASMKKAVRRFAEAGRPIYAECGGLMYLAEALEDAAGTLHPMVGLLPSTARMRPGRLSLGYTEVALETATPLGGAGVVARGHEFHRSTLDPVPGAVRRAYRIRRPGQEARAEGYLVGGTLMSYVHLHFASSPALAPALVAACRRGGA